MPAQVYQTTISVLRRQPSPDVQAYGAGISFIDKPEPPDVQVYNLKLTGIQGDPPEPGPPQLYNASVSILSGPPVTAAHVYQTVLSGFSGNPDLKPGIRLYDVNIESIAKIPPPDAQVGGAGISILHIPTPNRISYWDGVKENWLRPYLWDGDFLWDLKWEPSEGWVPFGEPLSEGDINE